MNRNRENEALSLNVLPAPIANRLLGGEAGIADGSADVTVAFADIVGFTQMESDMPPVEIVTQLNGLFMRFDAAAHELMPNAWCAWRAAWNRVFFPVPSR